MKVRRETTQINMYMAKSEDDLHRFRSSELTRGQCPHSRRAMTMREMCGLTDSTHELVTNLLCCLESGTPAEL